MTSLFLDASFWVLVSFSLFAGTIGVVFFKKLLWQLDQYASNVDRQVRESLDLHEEAWFNYRKTEKLLKKIMKEGGQLVQQAEVDAARILKHNADFLNKMEKSALNSMREKKAFLLSQHKANLENRLLTLVVGQVKEKVRYDAKGDSCMRAIMDALKN